MKRAVITGMGAVSPFGIGWKKWCDGLRESRNGVRAISLFDANAPRGTYCEYSREDEPLACRVAAEVPDFDAAKWLHEKDFDRVPRVVPLALCAAQEALCSADLSHMTDEQKRDTDVLLGSGGGGFSFAEAQFARFFSGAKNMSPYAISSSIAGMVSSEISIAHGFRGRSHTVSDGCTSSSDAFGYALDLIRNGRSARVIAGGADACITPAMMAGFCLMRAVPTHFNDAPQNASRPFSANRDGFVLGEGAWVFVVEELETARSRGAKIFAEIAGYGATCEAFHRVALHAPDEAARAMQLALRDAGARAAEIDYVNLHGTGTRLNDPLETAAAKLALGEYSRRIPMSSTKSQIGHPQGASGAAGIAAALFSMQENLVPPTLNLDEPDTLCDLDYVPHRARKHAVKTALCNCLGFGSKNAALVLRAWKN